MPVEFQGLDSCDDRRDRMLYGYARVSSIARDENALVQRLLDEGVPFASIYVDKLSRSTDHRPELDKLIQTLDKAKADGLPTVLYVVSMNDLAKTTHQLIETVMRLGLICRELVFLKEGIRSTEPLPYFLLNDFLHDFERNSTKERRTDPLVQRRDRREKAFDKPRVDRRRLEEAVEMYREGTMTIKQISRETGISHSTLYRELARRDIHR